jgi:hypothetical protein
MNRRSCIIYRREAGGAKHRLSDGLSPFECRTSIHNYEIRNFHSKKKLLYSCIENALDDVQFSNT